MDVIKGARVLAPAGAKRSYVVVGATVRCSCGTCPSTLKMTVSHGVYLKGKAQLNINDFKPDVNITTFVTCKSPKNPKSGEVGGCKPKITGPWLNGKDDVLIENAKALLNISINTCVHGGKIKIEKDGQE